MNDKVFDQTEQVSLKEALDLLKNEHDWIYQEAPSTPWYIAITNRAYAFGLTDLGYSPGALFETMGHDLGTLVSQKSVILKSARRLIEAELKGKSVLDWWIKKWYQDYPAFEKLAREIRAMDLTKLSNEKIWQLFRDFGHLYYELESPALCNELVIPYSDEHFAKVGHEHPDWINAVAYYAAPTGKSFLNIEEEELAQTDDLKKHIDRWFFIKCSYIGGSEPTIEELAKRKKELVNLRSQHKNKPLPMPEFDNETKIILEVSRKVGAWKDDRKKSNLIGSYILEVFAKEFARRFDIDYQIMRYALPPELPLLIQGDKTLEKTFKLRHDIGFGSLRYQNQESQFIGEEYSVFRQVIAAVKKSSDNLRGICASPGVVTATVRVVNDPNRDQFEAGEVLVTSMTRPEFVPLMKKAAAVLCDEGGLLSHAAIVSRELGIPCIVGLRHAMTSLKSGDKIEVDANNGMVKKL